MLDESSGLRIPLRLRGIFSYFETHKLTPDEVDEAETYDCIELSPESAEWDSHPTTSFPRTKTHDSFLDYKGELKDAPEPKRRKLIYDDDVMASSAEMCNIKMTAEQFETAVDESITPSNIFANPFDQPSIDCDKTDPILAEVMDLTGILDEGVLNSLLIDAISSNRTLLWLQVALPYPVKRTEMKLMVYSS